MAARELLTLVALNSGVLAVPMMAASMLSARLGVGHPAIVAGSALAGLAIHGSIVFWAFYFLASEGKYVALALLGVEVAVVAALLVRQGMAAVRPVAGLALPAIATVVFTVFVLSFGYLRGGTEPAVKTMTARFLPALQIDCAVALILARAVESDVRPLPDPLYSNWSASDRPPLQSGLYLSTTSILGREQSELQYSVASSLLQSLWVIGLWAFFVAARTVRPLAAVTTAAILFSGFTFLNTFYVWPKLLSAAFMLVLAAVFLTRDRRTLQRERACAVITGLSLGGALLAHTGAIIAVLALVVLMLVWREVPPARFIVQALLVTALLVAPWTAYQKFVNPPGDKLLKLQVAGIPNIETQRSLLRETVDHYRQVGFEQSVRNKLDNLAEPFRGVDRGPRDLSRVLRTDVGEEDDQTLRDNALLDLRVNQTFRLAPALGILIIGPILLGLAVLLRKGPLKDAAAEWRLVLFLAVTIVLWSLVLFGPNYTVLHQAPYVMPVLAFVLCVAACWRFSPIGTTAIVILQSIVAVYLYKDSPVASPVELIGAADPAMAALALISLLAAVMVLLALADVRPTGMTARLHPRVLASVGGRRLP